MKQAVLVIDVQHALCAGKYACYQAGEVIGRINEVTAKARRAGLPVVIIQHESRDGGALDLGTEGWQLAQGLVTEASDIRVRKTATDSFHETALQAVLQKLGVQAL